MGRFTASKYKNAAAKKLKKDSTAFGIRISELCQNDPIACGLEKVVFSGEGSSLGLLDVGEVGNVQPRKLIGHSAFVRSMEFSPFHSNCLATCAGDNTVRIWNTDSLACTKTFEDNDNVHMARFHPVADSLVLVAKHDKLSVLDLTREKSFLSRDIASVTVSWSYDGRLACSADKTGQVVVSDLRSNKTVASARLFNTTREIHHEWMGVDKLLLAGFEGKNRCFKTVDISDLSSIISTLNLSTGSGAPHVKFDYDTRMAFLYAKGDHGYTYAEVGSEGTLRENWKENAGDVIKGVAIAPKLALDVMKGEVNRLMVLHGSYISPTPFIVPRKSYHEFHGDLFPETRGPLPGVDGEKWCNGHDGYRELISLDPSARNKQAEEKRGEASDGGSSEKVVEVPVPREENVKHKAILSNLAEGASPYRNIVGTISPKTENFAGLKNVLTVFPPDCNGFETGLKYGVHLMMGTGGRLGVFSLADPGQNNTPQLEIVNVGTPLCFGWEPFSGDLLAVGGDCASVKLWRIEEGMSYVTLIATMTGHTNKAHLLCWHPGVQGLLASCSSDGTVILWDTNTQTMIRSMSVSEESLVSMCWDPTHGSLLYLASKCGTVTARDSQSGSAGEQVSLGEDIRSARIVATKDLLVVSSLGQGNSRKLHVLSLPRRVGTALTLLESLSCGTGTSLPLPFVDVDMNVGMLAARGEGTVQPYEFRTSPPHVVPLSRFTAPSAQFSLSLDTRNTRDVMGVEIARLYRLCGEGVQGMTFSVPRVRNEYFQDDLYPMSLDFRKPLLRVEDWKNKAEYSVPLRDLKPEDVKRVSEVEIVKSGLQQSQILKDHLKYKSHAAQRDELFNAFAEQVKQDAGPLEQDLMDGCEDGEWSD